MTAPLPFHGTRAERGQLILIGGLILASLLIILVLILNGVLFTETIATREQPQAIDRVGDKAALSEKTVNELIERGNEEKYESEGEAIMNVEDDIAIVSRLLNERKFEGHGDVTDITPHESHGAWVIIQEESSEFRAAESQTGISEVLTWEMGTFNGVRAANMTVSEAREIDYQEPGDGTEVFRMDIEGGSGIWSAWIYEDGSDVALATETDADGNPVTDCETSAATAEIDLVEMTINGEQCDSGFAEGVGDGPYTIRFNNGNESEGTYRFIGGDGANAELGTEPVAQSSYVLDVRSEDDDPEPTDPTAYDGIYSTSAVLEVNGPDVESETHFTFTPRQPPETKPVNDS